MNSNQLGKFSVDEHLIRSKPADVAQIFSLLNMVPVRAEAKFEIQKIEYTAISDKFDEVSLGEVIPEYILIIESDENWVPNGVRVQKLPYNVGDEQNEGK